MDLLRRCLSRILKYKRRTALLCGLILAQATFTAAPIYLIQTQADGALEQIDQGDLSHLNWFVLAFMLAMLLLMLVSVARQHTSRYLANNVVADIREEAVGKYLGMSMAYFNKGQSGDAVVRLSGDAGAVWALFNYSIQLVQQPLVLLSIAGVIISGNPLLGLLAFVFLPLAVIPIALLAKRIRRLSRRSRKRMAEIARLVIQTFTGMRIVIAYGQEEAEAKQMGRNIRRLLNFKLKSVRARIIGRALMQTLNILGLGLVILVGAHMLAGGSITKGEILAILLAILKMRRPLRQIISNINDISDQVPKAKRIFAVLDLKSDMEDAANAQEMVDFKEGITFEGVSFSYDRQPVLKDLSFTVPRGKSCAIVGPSGAGKSTVLNLVPRFHDVDSGRVLMDGGDIRQIRMASLRRQIALVSQEPFLFSTTVAENIGYGKPGASPAELEAAAKAANIHEEIIAFPAGYETMVGENGLALSGGQRQRVAIARAILRDAPILILDEATSSLDSVSERQVQAALDGLAANKTALIVAHRLSTISNADMIVVLVDGQVERIGTHEELLTLSPTYQKMWQNQQHQGPGATTSAPKPTTPFADLNPKDLALDEPRDTEKGHQNDNDPDEE